MHTANIQNIELNIHGHLHKEGITDEYLMEEYKNITQFKRFGVYHTPIRLNNIKKLTREMW
jgi:hypothetical protein